ncbi:MAG: hypothetical protein ACI959_000441 [Limisphaerales bacterium]|jgi:hypothetical protein
MIKEFRQFELFGHRTFVKATIAPPFRMVAEMENEACLYFVLKGEADVISHNKSVKLIGSEGLVMQCGNYLNKYICDNNLNSCEAIAIHLREDVLRDIYD